MSRSIGKKVFVCLLFTCLFGVINALGQTPKATTFVTVTPNRRAPEFYSEDLSLKSILVDLPGAGAAGSTWILSYEVYFLPEGHLKEVALKNGGRIGSDTSVTDFAKRIFLAKGDITKKNLKTMADRTAIGESFKFKSKIPEAMQMEDTSLVTVYSLKIYDATLKKSVVKTGMFFSRVFVGDKQKREKLYLNFYVSPSGDLSTSQLERKDDSITW